MGIDVLRGGGEEVIPVEGAGAVEEFEVEGGGGLAVDFSARAALHGHFSVLYLGWWGS